MFIERRNAARQKLNRVAQFYSEGSMLPRNCFVTDISEGGARLYADVEMPPAFVLSVSGEGLKLRRECRVIWRLGGELGVAFVDKVSF